MNNSECTNRQISSSCERCTVLLRNVLADTAENGPVKVAPLLVIRIENERVCELLCASAEMTPLRESLQISFS